MSPDRLYELSVELLDRSAEALDTIPVLVAPDLSGVPERAYVNMGKPAADCPDQLVVWAAGVREEPTGAERTEGTSVLWINVAEFHVQILRCQPTPRDAKTIIPATALQRAGRQSSADAWALWNHLHNLRYEGLLFAKCDRVKWDGMFAIEPSGGVGGWELTVRAQLDGYNETGLGT